MDSMEKCTRQIKSSRDASISGKPLSDAVGLAALLGQSVNIKIGSTAQAICSPPYKSNGKNKFSILIVTEGTSVKGNEDSLMVVLMSSIVGELEIE